MEKDRYIQWTVGNEVSRQGPWGYELSLSRDPSFSNLVFSRRTFDHLDEFEYDSTGTGTSWVNSPNTGLPNPSLGWLVRFRYSNAQLVGFVVCSGSKVYMIGADGTESGIEKTIPNLFVDNVSVDAYTGDAWILDSSRQTILVLSESLKLVKSFSASYDSIHVQRDSLHDMFWDIRSNSILVRRSSGAAESTISTPFIISTVSDVHLCKHTGDLFLIGESNSGDFFVHVNRRSGIVFYNVEAYSGIGFNGPSKVLLSKINGVVYGYEAGVVSIARNFSSLGIQCDRSLLHTEDDFYVLDRSIPEIVKINWTTGTVAWRQSLPDSYDSSLYNFDTQFESHPDTRLIHFWSKGSAGTVGDFPSGQSLIGVSRLPSSDVRASLLSFFKPRSAWSRITPVSIGFESSSSSSSSSESSSSDTSESTLSSMSSVSSESTSSESSISDPSSSSWSSISSSSSELMSTSSQSTSSWSSLNSSSSSSSSSSS